MEDKISIRIMYGFAIVLFVMGFLFNYFNLGNENFKIFDAVGNLFIVMGLLLIISSTLFLIFKRKKIIDERMESISTKALKIAYTSFIFGTLVLIFIDGIKPITMPYHSFLINLVGVVTLVYVFAYWILYKIY